VAILTSIETNLKQLAMDKGFSLLSRSISDEVKIFYKISTRCRCGEFMTEGEGNGKKVGHFLISVSSTTHIKLIDCCDVLVSWNILGPP